jgi:hypothetical protein
MLTAEGRQKAMAIPLRPRKMINSFALRAKPHPRVKKDCRMEPTWYMNLEPRASAMEPESRRTQPHVKAWMEDGLLCFVSTGTAPWTIAKTRLP